MKKRIKYVKGSEENFVNVNTEETPLIDWKKTLLRRNIDKSVIFNYVKDPRCL